MERKSPEADGSTAVGRFESVVIPHIDSAYNLARWLTRNEHDAQDVLQEACLRAFRFLGTFHGGNERAWLLAIVRNTFYSWLLKNRSQALNVPLADDDGLADGDVDPGWEWNDGEDALRGLEREEARLCVGQALDQLPVEFREILVLRELEEMSYREIAKVAQIPIGTVMSRLSRGRKLLVQAVKRKRQEP